MPLITAAYIAFAAGLLLGFGGVVVPAIAGAAVIAIISLWPSASPRSDLRIVALAMIAAAGVLTADTSRRSDHLCLAQVEHAATWTADLEEPAFSGAYVHATLHAGRCTSSAAISVTDGAAAAGARIVLRGDAIRGDHGLLIRHATILSARSGSIVLRLRARTRAAIEKVFGSDAPIAKALLIAEPEDLSQDLRDRYTAAGLIHMLSISGLHVAIIAMMLQLVLHIARVPRRVALVGTVCLTAGYVILIGAPPSAVRSAGMLAVGAASRIWQRPTSPWASLAIGAFLPLRSPATVLEVGYQLSVAGMAALTAAGEWSHRVLSKRLSGWRLAVTRDVAVSLLATLATAPLVAWGFGRLSLVAPIMNLIAAPLMAVILPMLFLALTLAPALAAARFVAGAAHPLLALFDTVARVGAAVPYGSLIVAPTALSAALCALAAAAMIVACASRFPGRALVTSACAFVAMIWLGRYTPGSGELEMHMIDVGQGDAVALRTPKGRWILVDAGRGWSGGDAGRTTVIPYLRLRGGDLLAFVLSHPHSDHVGGAASVIRALHPQQYWDAAFAQPNTFYRASLVASEEAHVAWHRVHPGDSLMVDNVAIHFLAPDSAWTVALTDPNLASAIMMVQYGAVRFLLTGDAEAPEESWVLRHAADLHADVLKVGHHGSSTSTTPAFLAAVQPRLALVSVGRGNLYGHPSPDVIHALAASGATVLRTNEVGSIVVRTDGHAMTVNGWPF